jgi:hypothetical protein
MFILLYQVLMVICIDAHHQSNLVIGGRIAEVLLLIFN